MIYKITFLEILLNIKYIYKCTNIINNNVINDSSNNL